MKTIHIKIATLCLGALLGAPALTIGPLADQASAAETITASPWVVSDHARIRLIPGKSGVTSQSVNASKNSEPDQRKFRAVGVQIELAPGWHTYWRNPGASGVPPRFDWSQSSNVESTKVHWPAPSRVRDEYGVSFGYLDQVIFPIHTNPKKPGENMSLKLSVDFAVCREICIPEFAELALEIPADAQAASGLAASLVEFEAKVPHHQSKLAADTAGPRIEGAKIELKDGKPVLAVTARLGASPPAADLFVEGPEEFFFVTPDHPQDLGGGRGLYIVEIKGAETTQDLAGAKLGCTLVNASGAIEHWWIVPKI